ncbi:MAG TPA: TIGR03435 family protein [Bryobacteraceae bacterium]|jgi:uncharacterized protein (TIGR03435 family)
MKLLATIAILASVAPAAPPPAFEVASIKPNKSGDGNSSFTTTEGSIHMRNVTPRILLEHAFNVKDYNLNAPSWVDDLHFDIVAKAPGEVKDAEMRLMLQSLLAERFQLKMHRESKEMTAYALLPAKGGFKLKPVQGDNYSLNFTVGGGKAKATGKQASMANLSDYLSGGALDHPVVDETGIQGVYDFTLEWSPEQNVAENGPSLFTALTEQLGLRLEKRKLPVSIVVVDSMNQTPTEN